MSDKRILITGSRTWPSTGAVWDAINDQIRFDEHERFVIVHGGAKGADTMAGGFVRQIVDVMYAPHGVEVVEEVHLARWDALGKRAGFVRNAEMVAAGADVCLAFIHNESRGATMCADLAEKAGIPVIYTRAS